MLDTLITSKTRVKLLIKFFSDAASSGHLRSLAQEFGESTNAIRLELNKLASAGLLTQKPENNTIKYNANFEHPFYPELKKLVVKYVSYERLTDVILQKLGNVKLAFIQQNSLLHTVDKPLQLVLVGDLNLEYMGKLSEKAKHILERDIELISLTEEAYAQTAFRYESSQCIVLHKA